MAHGFFSDMNFCFFLLLYLSFGIFIVFMFFLVFRYKLMGGLDNYYIKDVNDNEMYYKKHKNKKMDDEYITRKRKIDENKGRINENIQDIDDFFNDKPDSMVSLDRINQELSERPLDPKKYAKPPDKIFEAKEMSKDKVPSSLANSDSTVPETPRTTTTASSSSPPSHRDKVNYKTNTREPKFIEFDLDLSTNDNTDSYTYPNNRKLPELDPKRLPYHNLCCFYHGKRACTRKSSSRDHTDQMDQMNHADNKDFDIFCTITLGKILIQFSTILKDTKYIHCMFLWI